MSASTAVPSVTLWGIVKGIALEAIPVLAILDPPAGAALVTALAIADALVAALPYLEAGSVEILAAINAIDGHSRTVLLAAAPSVKVVSNPVVH